MRGFDGSTVRSPAWLAGLAAACLAAACSPDRPSPRDADGSAGEDRVVREVFAPGDLLSRFPADPADLTSDTLMESAFGLTVSGGSLYVLDRTARALLRFDAEGRLAARIGRPGEGPGELRTPVSLSPGPDGSVWVADPGAGRLSRFGPDGELLAELRSPYPVVNFTAPAGDPVFPTLRASSLFARLTPEGETVELEVDPRSVPHAVSGGPRDRLSLRGLLLTSVANDRVAMLRNRHGTDFELWEVTLADAGDAIGSVRRVPLPDWLYAMFQAELDRLRSELSPEFARGDFFVPFTGMHVDGDRLWLAPALASELLAFSPALHGGQTERVVVPRGEVGREAVDVAVAGGRLVVLLSTEVRTYGLERVPDDSFTPPS